MVEYIYEIESDEDDESEIFIGWIRNHSQELIRCKDCKWFTGDSNSCYSNGGTWFENEYCSVAERKEE